MEERLAINSTGSEIVFLGVCERAAYVRDAHTDIFKWDILGLKTIILSYLYPRRFGELFIGLALQVDNHNNEIKFRLSNDSDNEIGTLNINLEAQPPDADGPILQERESVMYIHQYQYGWNIVFLSISNADWVIKKPGVYYLEQLRGDSYSRIGVIQFAVVDPPPLSPDRIAAIKSSINSAKAARIELGCKQCPTKYQAYVALERNSKMETDGWTWYEEVPDFFECQCGRTNTNLKYVRKNLHGLLGQTIKDSTGTLSFLPLYERSSLISVRNNFAELINKDLKEEIFQIFINENPILLHQFPAIRIIPKPPILTAHVADFGIVTPQKELIFIEIEKTTTRIMKKDGGIAAPLSHAFDQVRDWLHVTDEHRIAVLDSLNIKRDEVSLIKGVVIAGRDKGQDAHNLRKLKGNDWGRVSFLTYDDILFSFDALISRFESL